MTIIIIFINCKYLSYQGVVKLFADKTLDHLSDVTVSSLTSIPTEAELKQQVADGKQNKDVETNTHTASSLVLSCALH